MTSSALRQYNEKRKVGGKGKEKYKLWKTRKYKLQQTMIMEIIRKEGNWNSKNNGKVKKNWREYEKKKIKYEKNVKIKEKRIEENRNDGKEKMKQNEENKKRKEKGNSGNENTRKKSNWRKVKRRN